jgi:hypothetical protein
MQTLKQTQRLEDNSRWRYDHVLNEEEEKNEVHFNKEMACAAYREYRGVDYSNVYWLLTEWRKNTPLLLEARKNGDVLKYDILLSHRSLLNHYLNVFLRKSVTKRSSSKHTPILSIIHEKPYQ